MKMSEIKFGQRVVIQSSADRRSGLAREAFVIAPGYKFGYANELVKDPRTALLMVAWDNHETSMEVHRLATAGSYKAAEELRRRSTSWVREDKPIALLRPYDEAMAEIIEYKKAQRKKLADDSQRRNAMEVQRVRDAERTADLLTQLDGLFLKTNKGEYGARVFDGTEVVQLSVSLFNSLLAELGRPQLRAKTPDAA